MHTIIFNRALGPVAPLDTESELFELTWTRCGGTESLDTAIEERISQFSGWVQRNPEKTGRIAISFYERREKQSWFSKVEDRLCWETWNITLNIIKSPDTSAVPREQRSKALQSALEDSIRSIVRAVNEKRDHIPPVLSSSPLTFPFEITISGEGSSVFNSLDTVRRMLQHTSPPSVLQ